MPHRQPLFKLATVKSNDNIWYRYIEHTHQKAFRNKTIIYMIYIEHTILSIYLLIYSIYSIYLSMFFYYKQACSSG